MHIYTLSHFTGASCTLPVNIKLLKGVLITLNKLLFSPLTAAQPALFFFSPKIY
jgi:hypothetical protein